MDKQACGGRGGEEMMGEVLVDNVSLPVVFHTHMQASVSSSPGMVVA